MRPIRYPIAALLASLLLLAAGPAGATVDSGNARFAERLKEAVTDALKGELGGPGRRVGNVSLSVPASFHPPEGYDTMELSLPYKGRLTDRVFVTVAFLKGGETLGRLNVVATTEVWAKVVVTTRDISRGAHVGKEDVALTEVRLDPSHNGVLSDLADAIGKTTERSLTADTPMREAYLANPMLVNNGDMVTVVADNGRIRISSQGVAKEDGDRGQWIRVMNLTSNKLFTARVVGPGRVQVEF